MRRALSLLDFSHILGAEAIEDLCARYGGTVLYIKKSYADEDELVKLLGRALVDALAEELGGDRFLIPLSQGRRARVKALAANEPKLTNREIALRVGIHERQVYRILSETAVADADKRQAALPF